VRKDYERAFGDGSISGKWHNFFSLVSSGFRKVELLEHPFDETFQYSEDSQWVNRREVKIVYVPDAIVEHSHNYTLQEVKKRFFNEGVADKQMGKKSPGLLRTWKSILAETLRDWIYLVKNGAINEFFYAPRYRYMQKMSYYRGTKK
jgi:rhamnosyltransferase